MQTRLSYRAVEPLKLWYPAVVFHHWCISVAVACHQMPIMFCLIALVSPCSLFSLFSFFFFFAYALWHFGFYPPATHYSCGGELYFFTIWVFSSFTVAPFSVSICSCLLCYWLTSQITWMSPWVNETKIHTRGAFMLIRGREATEDLSLWRHLSIKYELILFLYSWVQRLFFLSLTTR